MAGVPSTIATQVMPGELRTDSTTSPRIAMPNRLKSAFPASLPSIAGYTSTPPSCAANRNAEGWRRATESTAAS